MKSSISSEHANRMQAESGNLMHESECYNVLAPNAKTPLKTPFFRHEKTAGPSRCWRDGL
ncbi:MAG: hypothetical protein LBU32_06855 [Clostridiales bacterium]|nr:hypothetical protein [Clostridiales bacterium]